MATILIIDTNERCRRAMRAYLEPEGHQVVAASCAADGINLMFSRFPDLVLMDTQLLTMNGFEAASLMRRHGYHGKLVALSTKPPLPHRDMALACGFNDYIRKPLGEEFQTRVGQLVN